MVSYIESLPEHNDDDDLVCLNAFLDEWGRDHDDDEYTDEDDDSSDAFDDELKEYYSNRINTLDEMGW
jgi:hypothetical protein